MRSDMTRLLVHRGKSGKSWASKPPRRKTRRDYDNMPKRSGMKQGYQRKYFDEYLSPLKRFLQRRVGAPWNDVYSEIRQYLRVQTAVHLHVLQHLEQMVVLQTWWDDGLLYGVDQYGRHARVHWSRWSAYYVDKVGVLQEIPAGRRARRKQG
jgi:hypothetical protein